MRTTGRQGPGKADNWWVKTEDNIKTGGQLAGRVEGRRTTGGQGTGKADNWRAGSPRFTKVHQDSLGHRQNRPFNTYANLERINPSRLCDNRDILFLNLRDSARRLLCPQRVAYVCHMQCNTRTISFSLLTCVRFSSQKLNCFEGHSVRS